MNIERKQLVLRAGKQAIWEYDKKGDLLEIIFQLGEATCAVELTENIILRFDWEKSQPLSLSIMGASQLTKSGQYGEVYFELLTAEWPSEAHGKIMTMLKSSPLAEILKLGSYTPAHALQQVPLTTLKRPQKFLQPA